MPSRYSSHGTQSDARDSPPRSASSASTSRSRRPMDVYEAMLAPVFEGREPDITEENLQARIRGNLLMALSNKFGWLVLTTGNKSENAVGYSTLYGDSAGGFAVIKDVPKTLVYRLVDFRNDRDEQHPVPRSIVDRPPSAELRPDQVDADSLPDYDTLDAILQSYIEQDAGRDQLRWPASRTRRSTASSRSSTAASTSGARRRRGSRSRRARSGGTGACRSPTPTAAADRRREAAAGSARRARTASIAWACSPSPSEMRATPSSARRAGVGVPGRSRMFTGAPSAVKAAMSRSSAIPMG